MANLAPPSTQKAGFRPISFLLDDQSLGVSPPRAFVDLVVRPEDLVRTDVSRAAVTQTLGGAWVDNFGPGIPQITISGHTGWRRMPGDEDDGEARFMRLQEQVFSEWHASRARNVRTGLDPDLVRLVFSDALDNFSVAVVPMQFTLRRSKQRPLLYQYNIQMLVVDDTAFNTFERDGGFLDADVKEAVGLDSLTASVNQITEAINSVHRWVDATLAAPVRSFMQQTARLYGSVRGMISAGAQAVGSVINIARMSAQAGINLFRTVAAIGSIPQIAKASLMAVAGAYSNIFCVLRNALNQQLYVQDYSDLYGASNCSSTSGGRPMSVLAGENPFYSVVPTSGPLPYSITQSAQSALSTLASSDVVLSPMSVPALSSTVRSISEGLVSL